MNNMIDFIRLLDTMLTSVPILLLFHGILAEKTDYMVTVVICILILLTRYGRKLYDFVSKYVIEENKNKISKVATGLRQVNNVIIFGLITTCPQYMLGIYIYRVLSFSTLIQFNITISNNEDKSRDELMDTATRTSIIAGVLSFIIFVIIDNYYHLDEYHLYSLFILHQLFLLMRDGYDILKDVRQAVKTKP